MNHAQHEATITSRLAFQATILAAADPVNRWLIAHGLGHAILHGAHS